MNLEQAIAMSKWLESTGKVTVEMLRGYYGVSVRNETGFYMVTHRHIIHYSTRENFAMCFEPESCISR